MSANLKSIILMIIGMGCLTLCDLLIKIASQTLPLGQVMIIFGVGSIMVFLGIMRIAADGYRRRSFVSWRESWCEAMVGHRHWFFGNFIYHPTWCCYL